MMKSSMQVALEEAREKIKKLSEALESTVLLCKYNCCAASHCGRCRVALEALGEIDEYGEPTNERREQQAAEQRQASGT